MRKKRKKKNNKKNKKNKEEEEDDEEEEEEEDEEVEEKDKKRGRHISLKPAPSFCVDLLRPHYVTIARECRCLRFIFSAQGPATGCGVISTSSVTETGQR